MYSPALKMINLLLTLSFYSYAVLVSLPNSWSHSYAVLVSLPNSTFQDLLTRPPSQTPTSPPPPNRYLPVLAGSAVGSRAPSSGAIKARGNFQVRY